MLKKLLVLAIIGIILLGGSGCMKKELTREEKGVLIQNQLRAKYNEEFEPFSISPSSWAKGDDIMVFYPRQSQKDYFTVTGSLHEDGSYYITDGYFGRVIHDAYQVVVTEIVSSVYKEFKIDVNFGEDTFSDVLVKGTEVKDIYSLDLTFNGNITLLVKESSAEGIDADEALVKLAEAMRDAKMPGKIRVYYVFNEKYDEIIKADVVDRPKYTPEIYMEGSRKYIDIYDDLTISEVENG